MARDDFDQPGHPQISRRAIIGRIGAVVGAAALAPRVASAQGAPPAPRIDPTFDPKRDYNPTADPISYPDPDIITIDPAFNGLRVNNTRHSSPLDRRHVGRRARVVQPGTLPRLERHPERSAAALHRGRRPRDGVPQAVEQQQRQHVRLPGASGLVRARGRRVVALRARRLDHGHRRDRTWASASTRRTMSPCISTAACWFTDPPPGFTLYEGTPDAPGGPTQPTAG